MAELLPAAVEDELVELLARALLADLIARPGRVKTATDHAESALTVVPPRGRDRGRLGTVSPARRGRRPAGAEATQEPR